MKHLVFGAIAIVVFLLVVAQQVGRDHPLGGGQDHAGDRPGIASATSPAGSAPAAGHFTAEGLTLDRDASGQFHVEAAVNGTQTKFLVDTGADSIALTVADAQAAGIDVNPNGFQPILRTASGTGYGTLVNIERVDLGQTELHNVGAVVVKDLEISLLGQSVLARLGKVELQGDKMVLTPL